MTWPPPPGAFHRVVLVEAQPDYVTAEMEDDFHNFALAVRHDGQKVISVEGDTIRFPWSTCTDARFALARLAGMQLTQVPSQIYRHTDGRLQCTHQFELAGIAITQAARGPGRRLYEVTVTDTIKGERRATIRRDGELALDWKLADGKIVSLGEFYGLSLSEMGNRLIEHPSNDLAEAALILRRSVYISYGRLIELDDLPNAASMGVSGLCYSFQPEIAASGTRVKASMRDFRNSDDIPLKQRAKTGKN